jgi:hypothetical protein
MTLIYSKMALHQITIFSALKVTTTTTTTTTTTQ